MHGFVVSSVCALALLAPPPVFAAPPDDEADVAADTQDVDDRGTAIASPDDALPGKELSDLMKACKLDPNSNPACSELCTPAEGKVNLCEFADPTLAAIAELAAPEEVAKRIDEAKRQLEANGIEAMFLVGPEASPATEAVAKALGFPSGSTADIVAGFAKALAEVVKKRAKREALAWVLERLGKDLCTDTAKPYFPHLCALAGDGQRLGSYAADATSLETLQGALVEDVRTWPGQLVAASLSPGALTDASTNALSEMARGHNPADELHRLGVEASVTPDLTMQSCLLMLPGLAMSGHGKLESVPEREVAAVMTGLIGEQTCWEAIKSDSRPNKLTTILALWNNRKQMRAATYELERLLEAEAEFEEATKAKLQVEPVTEQDPAKKENAEKQARQDAEDALEKRRREATSALFGEAREYMDANRDLLADARLFKDFSQDNLKTAKALIEALAASDAMLEAMLEKQWGTVVATLARQLEAKAGTTDDPQLDSLITRLPTVAALLSAGEDIDQLEAVLTAAANPPGGWRSKSKHRNFTLSLTSFPGVFTAAEWRWGPYGAVVENGAAYVQAPTITMPTGLDFAWGVRAKGVERSSTLGFFVSLIDPAAFLGYDVDKNGKLPAPRPTIVLAPGFALRASIPNTPLTVLPYVVFRPQYRTWESTVDGPGANALQLGINLAIDVTLWTITTGARKRKNR